MPSLAAGIFDPIGGVSLDVFADLLAFLLITDDVFVIIALPYGCAGCLADGVDAPGGDIRGGSQTRPYNFQIYYGT